MPAANSLITGRPYQRITHNSSDGGIYANNINHQGMHGEETMRKSIYFLLHDARKKAGTPPFKSALIIGAGSGNDVAPPLSASGKHSRR